MSKNNAIHTMHIIVCGDWIYFCWFLPNGTTFGPSILSCEKRKEKCDFIDMVPGPRILVYLISLNTLHINKNLQFAVASAVPEFILKQLLPFITQFECLYSSSLISMRLLQMHLFVKITKFRQPFSLSFNKIRNGFVQFLAAVCYNNKRFPLQFSVECNL